MNMRILLHKGLSWGAFESVTNHIILTLHTIALFSIMRVELYGLMGVICSLIYLSTSMVLAGLDSTFGALPYLYANRTSWYHYVREQMFYTTCMIIVAMSLLWYVYQSFIVNHLGLSICIASIIAAETLKKTAKTLLALSGNFKTAALIECMMTIAYMLMVCYFL